MNKKKIIFDSTFIVTAAILLIVLGESGFIKENIGFALIPILLAYYLGQFVERRTRVKKEV